MGIEVELEIEARELGREVGVVDLLQYLGGDGGRPPQPIDQKELLFGADPPHAGFEPIVLEHLLERTAHLSAGALRKTLISSASDFSPYVLFSHCPLNPRRRPRSLLYTPAATQKEGPLCSRVWASSTSTDPGPAGRGHSFPVDENLRRYLSDVDISRLDNRPLRYYLVCRPCKVFQQGGTR